MTAEEGDAAGQDVGRRPRVVYVLHPDPGDLTPDQVLDRWPTAPRTLTALAATGEIDVVAVLRAGSRPRARHEVLHRDGVTYHVVADRGRAGVRLALVVRRLRPDVVHVNGLVYPLQTCVVRAVTRRRVWLVVQHHGEQPAARRRERFRQRIARGIADAVLFTGGEGQAAPWRAAGLLAPDVTVHDVLESSSDLRAPGPRRACRDRTGVTGDPAVLWVGRLQAGKDPQGALAAFATFRAARPGARLWVLTTERAGAEEAAIRARIAADPWLVDAVTVLGPVPHAEMAWWFGSCEVFLTTSRHEGSGYALIEAIACGCVPAWSDLPPHRSIAGGIGARFRAGDPVGAADALEHARGQVQAAEAPPDGSAVGGSVGWDRVVRELTIAYGVGVRLGDGDGDGDRDGDRDGNGNGNGEIGRSGEPRAGFRR